MTTARLSLLRDMMHASFLAAALVSPMAFAGPTNVPFKAAFTISESVVFGGSNGCNATGMIRGSGQASHLGRATLVSQDCIVFTSPTSPNFNFSSSTLVLQAANGDQLFATYSGTATPQAGGALLLSGQFILNGGTGRFASATGTGTIDGLEDISGVPYQPAVGTVMLSGKISY